MQVPILSGIYTDEAPDFRTSYPRNMVPVPKDQGISKGYLRPADGIAAFGTGPGIDRGTVVWNGVHYRVMGTQLVSVAADGTVTQLGTIAGSGQCTLDYGFDRMSISGGGLLYYWDGAALTQVTDPDIGVVVDHLWVDSFTMTTDGTSLIVNDLNNPYAINPIKYGSAEADPDPIKGLLKLRNEPYALGRFTIEVFNNIGGNLFPFQRNEGAQIQRGVIGTFAAAVFMEQIAFLGSGRNEAPAVWMGVNSSTIKISTREIDTLLQEYTEDELALVIMEVRVDKSHQHLMMHLPDQCLVYDGAASQVVGEPVWFPLDSGLVDKATYRARNLVWCYNKWLCADPTSSALGQLVNTVSTHYGAVIGWDFGTSIIYNESMGAIFHQMELVCLPGRVLLGADPIVWTSYSLDGVTWSMEQPCSAGQQGDRLRRLTWLDNGDMENWRIQRFRGTSDAHMAVARLEILIEALSA
ncbi:MAG: packaged DNA stabilization protein [Pseudomonadota bacterium]